MPGLCISKCYDVFWEKCWQTVVRMNKQDPASMWNFETPATTCSIRQNRLNNKYDLEQQSEVLYMVKSILAYNKAHGSKVFWTTLERTLNLNFVTRTYFFKLCEVVRKIKIFLLTLKRSYRLFISFVIKMSLQLFSGLLLISGTWKSWPWTPKSFPNCFIETET